MVLTLRTDKPDAEVGLFENGKKRDYYTWNAHRRLAGDLHTVIEQRLAQQNLGLKDLTGIYVYKGPGSFTGLRIGLSVANALAWSLSVPIHGATGERWLDDIKVSTGSETFRSVLPEYGQDAFVTVPRK